MEDQTWPPISAREALLSSPSGRKKYQEALERRKLFVSPMKKLTTTPNLGKKSQRLLDEDEDPIADDEDEDEETLKLQLAAIEAKLKLKKLKKNSSRSQANSSDVENQDQSKSKSTQRSRPAGRVLSDRDQPNEPGIPLVKVPLSPTKRPIPIAEEKSPRRVLLGIDKGATAGDISLRRAPSDRDNRLRPDQNSRDGRDSRFNSIRSRSTTSSQTSSLARVKSFSERMAGIRSEDTARQNRRERVETSRSSSFKLNAAEIKGYRAAAEEIRTRNRSRSPMKQGEPQAFEREEILRSYGNGPSSNGLHRSRTLPNDRNRSSVPSRDSSQGSSSPSEPFRNAASSGAPRIAYPSRNPASSGDSSLYDTFSETNLSTRILPHTFLERTLSSIAAVRLPLLLKTVKAPDFELPDNIAGDFAVFGIIASISKPYDHKDRKPMVPDDATEWEQKWEDGKSNAKKFMVLTLTDLKWTVDLFLFSSALPRYHRLSPGTVIAVLNPGIMPPKPGKIDTGAFSLTLHSGDDTILEIGTSRDLGFCKAMRKDGRECGSWVDTRRTEFCDFHVDLKVQRTQAGRMGVNTGSNAFGPGGGRFGSLSRRGGGQGRPDTNGTHNGNSKAQPKGSAQTGIRRDYVTGERYFISQAPSSSSASSFSRPSTAASTHSHSRSRSAAAIIDAELDDPFLAEGTVSRDTASRADRMRKRLATQQQEREIAVKLSGWSSNTGAEYLRKREEENGDKTEEEQRMERRERARGEVLGLRGGGGQGGAGQQQGGREKRRAAEDVSLSPVRAGRVRAKKTRFVTEKGIRVAGRESLATNNNDDNKRDGNGDGEEDDFLDIV